LGIAKMGFWYGPRFELY